jgi:hypothetical protein
MTEALRIDGEDFVERVASGRTPIALDRLSLQRDESTEAATSPMRQRGKTFHIQRQKART